ncbi:hypothetical protein BDR22DRAFT_786021, partial [Usnea florida]
MNERRNGIDDPANGTCEWISKSPIYLKWLDQQHGMLWIKGKPGAGKSTLMKHAVLGLEQLRGGDAVLASFFFHGRGALIQKDIAGLFRSLLHQLLLQLPELLTEFSSLHKKRTEREGQCGIKWGWHEKELQNFFKARITEAARTRTVRLYIDALDEAGEDTATELIHFFQQFSCTLAICFSCRHYPLLTLENGLEVRVEDGNGQDIDTYIRTSISTRILPNGIVHPLREDIAAKSSGGFQWVVLVIRLILRLYKNGSSLAVLRNKIEQLPPKLNDLYKELLESLDEEDLSESLALFQWVLFSLRPLRLSELRFALVMGQESTCISIRECQSSSWFSSTDKDLKRKVLALSRGLLELRDPLENYVVQFIHQSVKDFFLEGGLRILDKGRLNNMVGRGHFCLSRSCIRYLTMEDVRHWPREDLWYQNRDTVLPLLNYAAQFWYIHSQAVEKRDPAQACLLSMTWRSSDTLIQTWIKVSRMLRLDYDSDFPEAHWSVLHVASKLNLPSVVSAMLDQAILLQSSNIDAAYRDSRRETPLHLAVRRGHKPIVKMLLDRKDIDPNAENESGRSPLFEAAQSNREDIVKLLLDRNDVDPNTRDSRGGTSL